MFLDSGFDYVIRGEVENTIFELANALQTNTNPLLGNYNYRVLDTKARIVYNALKRWHTAHMAFLVGHLEIIARTNVNTVILYRHENRGRI